MARLPRVSPVGFPQHIIQRGNNHQVCFTSDQDFAAYANWLIDYSIKFEVGIHAWVFMSNHVHLLCTPRTEGGISAMMQGLGRQYVRYFNFTHNRTGTLWEGRFKSCLVQEDAYLLQLYRYIELNPVRANMVNTPAEYTWSSYQINALGKKSRLCTPHSLYLSLGKNKQDIQAEYRALFVDEISPSVLEEIRAGVNQGMVIGSDQFKDEIERLTGRCMHPKKKGRPKGWRKNKI